MIFQSLMGQRKSRCDIPSSPPKDVLTPLSKLPNQEEPVGVCDHTIDAHLFTL
jgi:hypothetical protein